MKNNMVYMVHGIKVVNAMWNAAFTKNAKQNSEGLMYGSPQALGYAIKDQLERDGYNILYKKMVDETGVMDLKGCFESKMGIVGQDKFKDKKFNTENNIKSILLNNFEDVINFGTVFTAKPYKTFGIHGAMQIGFGVNKYSETEELISEMLPCFSAENGKDKVKAEDTKNKTNDNAEKNENENETEEEKLKSNTLGEQYILDKAHFLYDTTLNPFQYSNLIGVVPGFEGYKEDNYQRFKLASIRAVSNLNSKSKKGCTNEFAMFVETKDDVRDTIDLNCLSDYINVSEKEDGTVIYDLSNLASLLNDVKEDIKSIEIFYDDRLMCLIGEIENAEYFNIKTRRKINKK